MFKKGDKVIRVIRGPGHLASTSGHAEKVIKVVKGVVHLDDCSLKFDVKTGKEIDSVFPGMFAEIIGIEH